MNVLADGKYLIVPGADPTAWIGADYHRDNALVQPVHIGGQMKTWTMKTLDTGIMGLTLERGWYATDNRGKVEVQALQDPDTHWIVYTARRVGPLIMSPDMEMAWTATGTEHTDPVVLRPPNARDPSQVWNFIPLNRPGLGQLGLGNGLPVEER